jgi:hypothetical protein
MAGLAHALEAVVQRTDDLFALELEGIEIVFRLPPVRVVSQYTTLLSLATDESLRSVIYEHIFRNAVVDDTLAYSNNLLPAGVPETISKLIFFLSGVDENSEEYTELLFKTYRSQLDSPVNLMQRWICHIFNGYTFEALEELNYQKLVGIFIQAEKVAIDRGIMDSMFEFTKPQEAKPKPFKVEDVIKQDSQAYSDFDKPDDPRVRANMRRVREEAIKRAQEEERKFKQRLRKR